MNNSVTIEYLVEVSGENHWIPKEICIDFSDFAINENELDTAACQIGQKMVMYGEIHAQLKTQLSRKEEEVKRVYSVIAGRLRIQGVKPNDAVKEQVQIDPDYQIAVLNREATRVDAIKAEAWWRTIQQVADLIRFLGYRQNIEIKKAY